MQCITERHGELLFHFFFLFCMVSNAAQEIDVALRDEWCSSAFLRRLSLSLSPAA